MGRQSQLPLQVKAIIFVLINLLTIVWTAAGVSQFFPENWSTLWWSFPYVFTCILTGVVGIAGPILFFAFRSESNR